MKAIALTIAALFFSVAHAEEQPFMECKYGYENIMVNLYKGDPSKLIRDQVQVRAEVKLRNGDSREYSQDVITLSLQPDAQPWPFWELSSTSRLFKTFKLVVEGGGTATFTLKSGGGLQTEHFECYEQ